MAPIKGLMIENLKEIESQEKVVILHAVKTGSRAWGFASPDSDYDVRFINVRDIEFYLKLEKTSDVIEWLLDEVLDIKGWDLQKALQLLHKSNPTLFEWSISPIVYITTPAWERIRAAFGDYFLSKHSVYHYLSMAEGNYREYLKKDTVRVKKYLYVIRPILACKWILDKNTPPPVLFSELVAAELDTGLFRKIEWLLDIKTKMPEANEMPKVKELNDYIEDSLINLKAQSETMPSAKSKGFDELNRLFIESVRETNHT